MFIYYDWSITLQDSPDICVMSVVEPHLFIAMGEYVDKLNV